MAHILLNEQQEQALASLFYSTGQLTAIEKMLKFVEDKYGLTHTVACDIRKEILPEYQLKNQAAGKLFETTGLEKLVSERD